MSKQITKKQEKQENYSDIFKKYNRTVEVYQRNRNGYKHMHLCHLGQQLTINIDMEQIVYNLFEHFIVMVAYCVFIEDSGLL